MFSLPALNRRIAITIAMIATHPTISSQFIIRISMQRTMGALSVARQGTRTEIVYLMLNDVSGSRREI